MRRLWIHTAASVVLLTGCDIIGPSGTEYKGTYNGEMSVTFSACSPSIFALSGTVRADMETKTDDTVSGTLDVDGSLNKKSGPTGNCSISFGSEQGFGGDITGTTNSLEARDDQSNTVSGVTCEDNMLFRGSLSSGTIPGTLTIAHTCRGQNFSQTGSATMNVTLR